MKKFIPFIFLGISLLFAAVGLLKTTSPGLPSVEKTENISTVINSISTVIEQIEKRPMISVGEELPDEFALAFYEKEITKLKTEVLTIKQNTNKLNEILDLQNKYITGLETALKTQQSNETEASTSFLLAICSLIVSVIAMLPSWIQLFREKQLTN